MKTHRLLTSTRSVADACWDTCRKIAKQFQAVKNSIWQEFRDSADQHLLTLALNEAEALALQTQFPQLFFPTLALEKAQSVRKWNSRQQAIWYGRSISDGSVRLQIGNNGK